MAKTVIGAEVKIEGLDKANQSVGTFKKQLREATNDLQTMADKFGLNSKEAQKAAMKVAGLKDAIGDAKALSDTFNPDKKFVALGGAIQGVTAGFSAFSGAMGLLGAESKETEALLLKVQSAMALQQGISGIFSAVDSFKLLGKSIASATIFQKIFSAGTIIAASVQKAFGVAVSSTSTGFKVLRAAIISTGIGALVVLIGSVISAIVDWAGSNESLEESQDRLKKSIEETTTATDKYRKAVNQAADEAVALAKSQGKGEAELFRIRKEAALEDERLQGSKLRALYDFYETQKELFDKDKTEEKKKEAYLSALTKYTDAYSEYENFKSGQRIAQYNEEGRIREAQIAAAEKQKEVNKKNTEEAEAELKKRFALLQKIKDDAKQAGIDGDKEAVAYMAQLSATEIESAKKSLSGRLEVEKSYLQNKADLMALYVLNDPDSIENKIAKINADLELELFALAEGDLKRQILSKQASDAIVQIKKDEAEAKKQIAEKEEELRQKIITGIANGLDTLAEIAGKQTLAGKVLAIASTVIKTIQGGIAAFTGMVSAIPGPVGIALGVVAAAGVVAAGVKAVKQITAVKVPGTSGGGGAPSISSPQAPLTPQAQTTTLNQNSINAVGNAASRVFVLETDVSNSQERIRRLNRAARIN